ncbi:hypothetical protein V492_04352 [Pseudogymnoascus sp. VKM F-4246]|nr:hypothetical protein V492_04352 [Pseudogymnoascus sp. VKM F-4246]
MDSDPPPPSETPSIASSEPLSGPSDEPLSGPSDEPLSGPSDEPLSGPSDEPLSGPSDEPPSRPSDEFPPGPSSEPLSGPSNEPLSRPSGEPSSGPSGEPSSGPSADPLPGPSEEPLSNPGDEPPSGPGDEPPSGPGDSDSMDDDTDVSFDENAVSVNWAGDHLLDARTALASYSFATRTLRRQVLEEVEAIRLGVEHHGPPPAHSPRVVVTTVKHSAVVTDRVPSCSIFGPGNIEAQLDDAIRHEAFGRNRLMPYTPPREDPLRDAFGGVETMAVRNPSIKWGAMVPRHHFPGAEVEGVVPEMLSTPEYVVLRRHVCGTLCPDDCHEGGGVRRKGKERAVSEVADVEGGEEMEGVVYAHWGDDDFDQSEDSGPDHEHEEQIQEQEEEETIETLEHCTVIERHRKKWAAEIGALTYKARIMTDRRRAICLNTIERDPDEELEDPAFVVTGMMIKRMDDARERADNIKQERARKARKRIAKWRARMMGRDTTEMGDDEGEAMFSSLVDSGDVAAQEGDPDNQNCDGAPGPAPRSPVKENSAIDDSPQSTAVTENPPVGGSDEAMPLQESQPTVESTEEVVSDLAEVEDSKLPETATQEDTPENMQSLETTSQETAEEESIARALIAQAAIARDATSPDPDLADAPMLEPAPQEATSGEASPEDAAIEKSTPKKTTFEEITTEEEDAEETSTQGDIGPGPGPSRKRPAPDKSSLKRRPAKRQSIRESPFLDHREREKPALWVLQRDGRLVRNPLADSNSGPEAGRRWSDPHIGAPVPRPPSDSEPRPRSTTVSEGTELPVPRWSTGETPRIGDEGQITQHIEDVDDSPALPSPNEWALADRESMPPPPTPRPRNRSLAFSEGSSYPNRFWSPNDTFPSIERLCQSIEQSSSGGDSAADVTSLAPARASTPEPPDMSPENIRENTRNRARALATLIESAAEERFRDPDPYNGLKSVRTGPRIAESRIPHRPRRTSHLRMELLVDEEAIEAEESERSVLDVVEEQERGVFASRVPDPPRYNLRSGSSASTENPSPVSRSVFSPETSERSSETTSVAVTPTGPTNGIQERESNLPIEGSMGVEGSMGREESMEREGSFGRELSITSEVAETLGDLAVETASERVGEGGGADPGSGVPGMVLPSTEVPEEAVEDDGEGAPLARVTSHSSTRSL